MSSSGEGHNGSARGPVRPPKPGKALSVFLLVSGLAILGLGSYLYVQESGRLADNVEVTAQITDAGVEEIPGSRGRDAYVPTVAFQYRFEGTDYTADNISPGDSQLRYEDRASAQARLSAFAVGESVTAYVDPDAPGEAYLEDSRSGQGVGAFVFGAALSLVSGGRLYQLWRGSRQFV